MTIPAGPIHAVLGVLLATSALAQPAPGSGTLLKFDFEGTTPWPVLSDPAPGAFGVWAGEYGTVDTPGSAEVSGGLMLVSVEGERDGWTSALTSGPLAVQNSEGDAAKLTLAFSLTASRALPIKVVVTSLDAEKNRTGAVETFIHPAAADFYQRYALDLVNMKPSGEGTFDPTAPFVEFSFVLTSEAGWPAFTRHRLCLDNVQYARPAFYVAADGDDTADGRTEATAFANPQRALDAAEPGDIIVVMNGTYGKPPGQPDHTPVADFKRSGTPAAWISLKNYPGHTPQLSAGGQPAVRIALGGTALAKPEDRRAYIEVRGFHLRGDADVAREKYADEVGRWTRNTHSRGVFIFGRRLPKVPERGEHEIVHHIRIADNLIDYVTGDGLYAEYADWLYVENNRIRNNCWLSVGYVPSGLVVMGFANFDPTENITKMLIAGNEVSGNRLTLKNEPGGDAEKTEFWNGNGILLDDNAGSPGTVGVYAGRTLVQNNLIFNNGAGGIQMWGNHRMDLVNNTLYHNGTVLPWGEIGLERCRDVRLINNIIVAQTTSPLDAWMVNRIDRGTDRIVRTNNLYWGGAMPNIDGVNDLVSDPQFVNPGIDPETADFRVKSDSPALGAGRWELFTPCIDYVGQPRPVSNLTLGAYQN